MINGVSNQRVSSLLEKTIRTLQVDYATITLGTKTPGVFRIGVVAPDQQDVEFIEIDAVSSYCERVFKTGQTVRVSSPATRKDSSQCNFMRAVETKSYLGAPMYDPNDTIIGVLAVQSTDLRIWSTKEIMELEAFAVLMGYTLNDHTEESLQRIFRVIGESRPPCR